MRRFLFSLLALASIQAQAQNPDFVSEIAYDYCSRLCALSPDSIAVSGGHLAGVQFSARCYLMGLESDMATNAWTFGEFSGFPGFATDVIRLSDGNLLFYVPEDVALIGQDLNLHLYKLSPQGELLWQVDIPQDLETVIFQVRFQVFENDNQEIVLMVPVTQDEIVALQRWTYDLEGSFISAVDTPIEMGSGLPQYRQGDSILDDEGNVIIAGRYEAETNFLTSIAPDGSTNWETLTLPPDTAENRYYSQIIQLSNGDYLAGGYYSYEEVGNYGMIQRFDSEGNAIAEKRFDNGPSVSTIRTLVELEDGRIAIGGRWSDGDDGRVPRLWIVDETLETEYFSMLFDYEATASLESMIQTEEDVLVGINDIILGTTERTDIWRLTSEVILSTDHFEVERFTVGPNPVKDELWVRGEGISSYSIYTQSGQLTCEGKYTGGSISIAELSPGIYLLQLSGDNAVHTLRIIKQ